jgi:hypothetical protein
MQDDYQRPPTLYRYDLRSELEQALSAGVFHLVPANGFLTLSFSRAWDRDLFSVLGPADSCLVVHNTELFGERLHRAVQRALPNWAGIDGAVEYGARSRLGVAFSKLPQHAREQEWKFAWRSMAPMAILHPVTVRIGNIEAFAELRAPESYLS